MFRARHILALGCGAVVFGTLIGAGTGVAASWGTSQTIASAAIMSGLIWLFAVLLGVQTLVLGTGFAVDRLGPGVLASSMARMLVALLVGVVVYFLVRPEGHTYWTCFLSAGLLALTTEASWAVRTINAATRETGAIKHGAA
ncbi:MAG TPA: hypothetical protein VHC70_04190 [Phycisphaerales bacterium]|nr:hypothetical protein [Phycisphaerales bacterium]